MKKGIVIIIGLLVTILLMGSFILGTMSRGDNLSKKEGNLLDKLKNISVSNENKSNREESCPENWKFYKQDTIGIEFCYPEEKWGEAKLYPVGTVTDLSKLLKNKHYYQDPSSNNNNGFYNILEVIFEKSSMPKKYSSPTIRLMRNNAPVNKCDDSDVIGGRLGCNENVLSLKKYQDICKYSVDYKEQGTLKAPLDGEGLKELYNECNNGLKITLSERSSYFNWKDFDTKKLVGWRYQYFLDMFAYKKLQNGYFDDALIYYDMDNTSQIKNKLATFQDFFNLDHSYKSNKRITLSQEEFQQKKVDFEKFVKSIKIFEPVKEDLSKYKVIGTDDNTKLIAKYYWLLTNKKFTDAYNLKQTNQSLDEFIAQYKNIYYAKPYDFVNKDGVNYEFYVKYQDHNNIEDKYQVEVEIVDGKIKTNLAQKFLTDKVKYSDKLTAYAVVRGNKNYIVLEKNGREIIVDQGDAKYDKDYKNMGDVKNFANIKFSPHGNYLMYNIGGYEWVFSMVYDIRQEKIVKKMSSGEDIRFTNDEKYIYMCGMNNMSGNRTGIVQSIPDFVTLFDVYGQNGDFKPYPIDGKYNIIKCEHDKSKNIIRFILSDYDKKYPEKVSEYIVSQ